MKRYIYIFMAMALALSCGKEPEPVEPPVSEGRVTLQVTSDSRQLESAEDGLSGSVKFKTRGGSLTLDVLTNQDEWTYETEGADWLDIESDDYFLILDAERNASDALRTATVRIFAGEAEKRQTYTLEVTQNHQGIPEVSLAENNLRVKATTGLVNTIEIETNQEEWDFDCTCSWLLIEKEGNALKLTADPNATTLQRTAEIEISAGSGDSADSDWLVVSQDGKAYVILSTQNVATDDEGDTKTVTVTSNPELEWTVVVEENDWFSASAEGNELTVEIQPNIGGNERLGSMQVIVGDEDNNAVARVNVRQIGPDTEELIYEVLISEPDFLLTGAPVLTSNSEGSVTVDWGDGTPKETFEARRPTHVYAEPGRYTIEISGAAESLEFGDGETVSPELQSIISWGKLGYKKATDMCLGCINLKSIPNDVAGSFANVKTFLGAFSCCESLEEIPSGLFRYATLAKNFEHCFSHTASISEIPEALFANCVAAEDFSYTFYAAGSGFVDTADTLPNFSEVKGIVYDGKLTSIPEGLFGNCPAVKQMDHVFGATAITSVPGGIFAAQANATIFTGAFVACVRLKEIHPEFMSKATAATDIKYMFSGCESLEDIPAGMFVNNSAVTNLEYIFHKTGVKRLEGGIFQGLVNVKTIGAAFMDCISLSELSTDLFKGLTSARSFRYCFSGCTSLRNIPSGLFAGMTNAVEFTYTFESTALESVPVELFVDCKNSYSLDLTYIFAECKNLKTVPAGLFDTLTKLSSPGFKNAFEASGIETIPAGLFAKNTDVTSGFEETFYRCESLKTIEGPIFAETSSVSSLARTFLGCTALEEIPEDLFSSLAGSKTKYTATFKECTSLKSLPEGLFTDNVLATHFVETFRGCTALESIPENLIGENSKVTYVSDMFAECTSLTELPEDLFSGTPAITSFEGTFANCTSLESLPETLFSAIGTKTSSVTFAECFFNCSSLKSLPASLFDTVRRINYIDGCFYGCASLTGESPYTVITDENGEQKKIHLYERTKGDDFPVAPTSASAHEACFTACTGLTDYNEIPADWK